MKNWGIGLLVIISGAVVSALAIEQYQTAPVVEEIVQQETVQAADLESAEIYTEPEPVAPEPPSEICDGIEITSDCVLDDVVYSRYIYHPAVPAQTRTQEVVTYHQEIVSYCTLCRDGTYSPSCATGRGACSHHGGVQQWNAPRYGSVPIYETKVIVDEPAQDPYYEKIIDYSFG